MSNTIRLSFEVYQKLDAIREKRETFSEVVDRILRVYATLKEVSDTLGPSHYLKEHPLGGRTAEDSTQR